MKNDSKTHCLLQYSVTKELILMVKQVQIGKSDLYVNPIGLGTNAVGGDNLYPNLEDENGRNIVRAAFDQWH